jgi:hypothetical protein
LEEVAILAKKLLEELERKEKQLEKEKEERETALEKALENSLYQLMKEHIRKEEQLWKEGRATLAKVLKILQNQLQKGEERFLWKMKIYSGRILKIFLTKEGVLWKDTKKMKKVNSIQPIEDFVQVPPPGEIKKILRVLSQK